jgi:3-phenylpropionate/trans-cinnamate dioxygenase ferredoxin component
MMNDPRWVCVGNASDVTDDTPLSATAGGIEVGIYRVNGAIHALEDICPHADALLSQGFVDGEYIECPLHGALFHIPTGKCTKGPADRDLVQFDTMVEAGKIYLRQAPKE